MAGAARDMAHRMFRDAVGRLWEAWEVTLDYLEARAHGGAPRSTATSGWVAFETRGDRRRLTPIAPD